MTADDAGEVRLCSKGLHPRTPDNLTKAGACLACRRANRQRYDEANRETIRAQNLAWAAANRERINAAARERLAADTESRERKAAANQAWAAANPDKVLAKGRRQQARDRALVFGHYGWACRCCGQDDERYLTLDHVYGDGGQERLARSGANVGGGKAWQMAVRHYRSTGTWRDDFQTLCTWCNNLKGKLPRCPCGARDELPGQLALWDEQQPA